MSVGSLLAGIFGCDNCSKMHRRAQRAESEAAKWRATQLRRVKAEQVRMGKPKRSDVRAHRLEQLRNALEYIASRPASLEAHVIAARAIAADDDASRYAELLRRGEATD